MAAWEQIASPGQLDSLLYPRHGSTLGCQSVNARRCMARFLRDGGKLGTMAITPRGDDRDVIYDPMISYITSLPAPQRDTLLRVDLNSLGVYTAEQVREIRFNKDGQPMQRQIHPPSLGGCGIGMRSPNVDLLGGLASARKELQDVQDKTERDMQSWSPRERIRRMEARLRARRSHEAMLREISIGLQLRQLEDVRKGL